MPTYFGYDVNLEDGRGEKEKELPSTVILLVNIEQAMVLVELEVKGTIHLTNQISLTGDKVDLILEGVDRYLMELAKEQILIAFEQVQKEVSDLRKRTREGMRRLV